MPIYVHVIDHPEARRAGRHRHDGAASLDGRHGSPPPAAERAGPRSGRHRHRRQHAPARRSLRRQPPLRRQADLRPAPGARRRAQRGRLHHSRVGRGARRAVRSRSTASSSCCPGSDSSRRRATHPARRWSSSRLAGVRSSWAATWRFGSASSTSRTPKASCGARARPRAGLARARARAMATPSRSDGAGKTCYRQVTGSGGRIRTYDMALR